LLLKKKDDNLTFRENWQYFVIERKVKKMKFNIFKNRDNMTTENTEIDKEMDDVTLDNNASEEQVVADELSVEDQLTQDLAKEKINIYGYLQNLKIIKRRTSKERIELYKTANQEVFGYVACFR
jgi:molecular chaperone GrpE